jgi:hypothetical protein
MDTNMSKDNEVCCPRCGCNDVEIIREPSELISDHGPLVSPGRATCGNLNCREEFTFAYKWQGENLQTRPWR